jgi:hypothetical protein
LNPGGRGTDQWTSNLRSAKAIMSMIRSMKCTRSISRLLAATAWVLAAALPARAHVVPVADMLHGIRMTQAQCDAIPMTVWLKVMGRDFCMRYYLSTAGGAGSRPVVFLQGDRLGRFNRKTDTFSPGPHDKDINTDDFVRFADGLSKQTKTTAIYLGRVGVEGSSGNHRIRHSVLELNVTNAALDAIKQRHRFDGFHLIGQSGGSTLIGGMLALRPDIGCAVLGSGRLSFDRPQRRSGDPGVDVFNVADGIATIAQKRATRILVVTDPSDRKVPERIQSAFVRKLQQAGGQAEQFMVQAIDDDHHGVVAYARNAATGCLRGASTQDIAQHIQRLVEKRVAAKAKTDAERQATMDLKPGQTNASATAPHITTTGSRTSGPNLNPSGAGSLVR